MRHNLVVIVLVYNSAADAKACVEQLLSFSFPLRIVVVDNCSPDGSFEVLQEGFTGNDRVDVIQTNANKGYSAGNNYGIRYARERYGSDTVAVMNPDVFILNEKVLSGLMQLLWMYDDVLAVGGQPVNHLDADTPWPSSWTLPTSKEVVFNHCLLNRSHQRNNAVELGRNIYVVDCIVGCFFLAKTEKFIELGLLDEGVFLYNEENILGKKCKAAGLRLLVDKTQVYYHNHAVSGERKKSLSSRLGTQRVGYISRLYLIKTYYSSLLVGPLWCVEKVNELVLVLSWLRHLVFDREQPASVLAAADFEGNKSSGLDQ